MKPKKQNGVRHLKNNNVTSRCGALVSAVNEVFLTR